MDINLITNDTTTWTTTPVIDHVKSYFKYDGMTWYISELFFVLITELICLFGMGANVINIIVFYKQGVLTEHGTTTMFGLAIADFGCVLFMLWMNICKMLAVLDPPTLPFYPLQVGFITSWPFLTLAQIGRVITALLSFERAVCVVFPFHVTNIFTPKRSFVAIIFVFITLIALSIPTYFAYNLASFIDSTTNETKVGLISISHIESWANALYTNINITVSLSSMIIVFICSSVTAVKVNLSQVWRQSVSSSSTANTASSKFTETSEPTHKGDNYKNKEQRDSKIRKESKLIKMILIICVIFFICYMAEFTYLVLGSVEPDFGISSKRFGSLAKFIYNFIFLGQSINCSVNIVVYYTMSTRYRQQLQSLFGKDIKK